MMDLWNLKNRIIADSSCDLTPEMRQRLGVTLIPFIMRIGNREFIDDDALNVGNFVSDMDNSPETARSAAPAPQLFQDALEAADEEPFIVTLSSKLSASYANAVEGVKQAARNYAAHVFDSKSATAGETLIALKLHEMIRDGAAKEHIISTVTQFIANMKTFFVLENYNNLIKNGRMGKVTCSFIQLLNIKLIMGADENGEIKLFEKCRGMKRMLRQLVSMIETSGRETANANLVISHCNNRHLAEELANMVKERFRFKEIYIVPTSGLSSLYAANGGIIMAF